MDKENLLALADHLEQNVSGDEFDMETYSQLTFRGAASAHSCGSVGCAIGHGVAIFPILLGDANWMCYTERVFGVSYHQRHFLFSARWSENTTQERQRQQAIARLRFAATATEDELSKEIDDFFLEFDANKEY